MSPSLEHLRKSYARIFAIVSPPRCSSTAFARVFWEHPDVRYYAHEPFEVTYYQDQGLDSVVDKLENPLDLAPLTEIEPRAAGSTLVIKEMPYQVGRRFPMLVELADEPIIFLLRDPRLNIASRMAKKREVGANPIFPAVESGWELLSRQIAWCRERRVEHLLVDSSDFRNRPGTVFPRVFARLGLDFRPSMLDWRACPGVELDNLGGEHRHLYGDVLSSTGIRPETDAVPELDSFPRAEGWRDHVERCLAIYRELVALDDRLDPAASC